MLTELQKKYQKANNYEKKSNIVAAYKLYCELADKGYALAQYKLGKMYLANVFLASYKQDFLEKSLLFEVMENLKKLYIIDDNQNAKYIIDTIIKSNIYSAKKLFELAASQNNADALCALGLMYVRGHELKKDFKLAEELYKLAIQQGHSDAKYHLGELYIVDDPEKSVELHKPETTIELYKEAEKEGCALAKYNLSIRYDYGERVEQNKELAVQLNKEAADLGCVIAKQALSKRYYTGKGVEQNKELAVQLNREAAEAGCHEAQNVLGEMYLVQRDYSNAFKWFVKAAIQNSCEAISNIGDLYCYGLGVPQDLKKAAIIYKKAADLGHAKSLYNLAMLHMNNILKTIKVDNIRDIKNINFTEEQLKVYKHNFMQAKSLLELAVQDYYPEALFTLGEMYEVDQFIKNIDKAIEFYKLAIKEGHIIAAFNLGKIYINRNDLEKNDLEEGIKLLTIAADAGYASAKQELSVIYNTDDYGKQDKQLAVKLNIEAAILGNFLAQQALIIRYETGDGVTKDVAEANKWSKIVICKDIMKKSLMLQGSISENDEHKDAKTKQSSLWLYEGIKSNKVISRIISKDCSDTRKKQVKFIVI